MHRLRSDRKCTAGDLGGRHGILDKATDLQEYTELHSILLLTRFMNWWGTLMDGKITSIAKDDGIRVFAVAFVTDCTR